MKLLISLSAIPDTNFPRVGAFGIEGTNFTIFVGSPKTAISFVSYLKSCGAKEIHTGKRGTEYLVGWNKPFVDVSAWKRAGRPSTKD